MEPAESIQRDGLCPKCNKKMVLGVSYQVEKLADKPVGVKTRAARPFESIVPLAEVIAEMAGVRSVHSVKVQNLYFELLNKFGSEFYILREQNLNALARAGYPRLAEGLGNMRKGHVLKQAGYDGTYGVIKVFAGRQRKEQMMLFS